MGGGRGWPVIPALLLASFYHSRRLMRLQVKDTDRILKLFRAPGTDLCPVASMDPTALKVATAAAEILLLHFTASGNTFNIFPP